MFKFLVKMFGNYDEAKAEADASGEPLWDTRTLPERYAVGELSVEVEEDPDNAEWEQLQ